jgi:hypothetical protein
MIWLFKVAHAIAARFIKLPYAIAEKWKSLCDENIVMHMKHS